MADIAALIEQVRKYPCLYDRSHNEYRDNQTKVVVWKIIGQELNQSPEVAKSKWKNLRDTYVKFKNKNQSPNNTRVAKWVWAKHMRFMDTNHNIPRRFQLPDSDPDPDQEMFSKEQMETPLSSEPLKREKNTNRGDSVDSFLNMKSSNKKEDSIDLLFMSYARTCKKLSVQKQIQIKLQLAQIFGEAELSELTDS